MKRWELNPWRSWGTAARYGAAGGFSSALVYGALATLYIILRSSAHILNVLSPAESLGNTLVANAFSIVWPCLVITLLLGVLAALIEMVAFLIIYGLSLIPNGQKSPFRLAAIGFVVAGSLVLLVNLLVGWSIRAYWNAFWPMGFLFWLGLPSLIFIGTTTWLCRQEKANPISQQAELTQVVV